MTTQNTNEPQQENQLNLSIPKELSKKIIEIKKDYGRLRKSTLQYFKENNIKRTPKEPIRILYEKNIKVALKNEDLELAKQLLDAENERLDLKYKTA